MELPLFESRARLIIVYLSMRGLKRIRRDYRTAHLIKKTNLELVFSFFLSRYINDGGMFCSQKSM